MIGHHLLRAAVQVAGAAVIAQTTPEAQHFVGMGGGKIAYIGKAIQESCVVAQYGCNLRLLEHDFRKPDPVRIACVLPRQAVATMVFLPLHQLTRKVRQGSLRCIFGRHRR